MGMADRHLETNVMARLDDATLARVDALHEELTRRAAGVRVSRAAVIKQAILRGLDSLERETKKTK